MESSNYKNVIVKKAQRIEEIYRLIDEIRKGMGTETSAETFETNFYAKKDSVAKWIEWNQLEYAVTDRVLFLLRSSKFYKQLYYFAYNRENLKLALKELIKTEDKLNIDYLAKEDTMKDLFEDVGFKFHITLHRMARIVKGGEDEGLSYGEYAVLSDAAEIQNILEQTMDLDSDQVPGLLEIEDYINRNMAIVIRDKACKDIISCSLWTRKGKGMIWNYWALNPKYNGTTYSIDLLDAYLRLNGSVVRSTLFVRDRNPASLIYKKIGFQYDGLKDFVYCYRANRKGGSTAQ